MDGFKVWVSCLKCGGPVEAQAEVRSVSEGEHAGYVVRCGCCKLMWRVDVMMTLLAKPRSGRLERALDHAGLKVGG